MHPLKAADQLRFLLAGNARVTLRSARTQQRFTYRVRACEDKPTLFFVDVLTGPDNGTDWTYLGTLRAGAPIEGAENHYQVGADGSVVKAPAPVRQVTYKHGVKSTISEEAPSSVALAWWVRNVGSPMVEVFHEGRCGRCGRVLTVPESVERGIGPECWEVVGG